ncbi:uncharacterized protein LOC133795381 [Humulus lupulus]|uniref:uncharacterized protein LOC133795381 n=1 Tax=Humulus lupulus TaxID=3486 RepID=UPI002B411B51|nr:uncharacterized protein LOC133795381 [Humulus lupulus]
MSTISWNCRGLGNPQAQQFLEDICVQKKPKFLFLCETLCKKDVVDRVKTRLGFESCFSVDIQGRKGGLALLWRVSDEAHLLSYSHNHIDIEVRIPGMVKWRLTDFHGEPNRSLRERTWNLIRTLFSDSNLPWCIIGDFNNIASQEEKRGGRPYPSSLISGFQAVINGCQLHDQELRGYPYTWERSMGTNRSVEIRLDKALTSQSWLDEFQEVILTNLAFSSSDHSPIFLEPEPNCRGVVVNHFRYENVWSREPLCAQIVMNCWDLHNQLSIVEKIKICSPQLANWGQTLTGNFKQRITKSKKLMAELKNSDDHLDYPNFVSEKNNYFEILAQQEIYWKQRSKQYWLHAANATSWSSVVSGIRCSVNTFQNEELLKPILDDEVKVALFQMHPDKAPDPDGMGPNFFQHHWGIVGADIVNMVKDFFVSGTLHTGLNETNLVLIPKKKNFSTMSDLRPIALCNVLYKVISKVLANPMRGLIDQIISDTQSTFIPGHLISNNVMVAFEVMHYLKRKRKGKKGFMALKLDMSKAYDRVEWGYLQAVMVRMGFHEKWVDLVMTCVSSVRYNIIHGGHVMGPICPSRGIRQGDPLSTYLFIICAEGLSSLIQKFEANWVIQGCRMAQRAPSITHMFFADDSYLFCQATRGAAKSMLTLLHLFETASGQKRNTSKSSVFFSPNTDTLSRI